MGWSRQQAALTPIGSDPIDMTSWSVRLRAVGLLLDREAFQVQDFCILEVEGGLVVQVLAWPEGASGPVELRTTEYATDDLMAVIADATTMARGAVRGSSQGG